ncbi:hypothetical protein D7O28_21895, partial [Salmonella enterica subsp. enterica]|nr:hypothetical protein [Salmonella enterica subsp. enterica serovar Kua]
KTNFAFSLEKAVGFPKPLIDKATSQCFKTNYHAPWLVLETLKSYIQFKNNLDCPFKGDICQTI